MVRQPYLKRAPVKKRTPPELAYDDDTINRVLYPRFHDSWAINCSVCVLRNDTLMKVLLFFHRSVEENHPLYLRLLRGQTSCSMASFISQNCKRILLFSFSFCVSTVTMVSNTIAQVYQAYI